MAKALQAFTEEYKQKVKLEWYSAGQPKTGKSIQKVISKDENDRMPSAHTLDLWKKEYGWELWADEMDTRAMTIVEDELVIQKVEMLKRQAKEGAELQDLGLEYIREKGFDSSSAAVSAVIRGSELERESRGIGELIQKMAKMDDGALRDTIMSYIDRASQNDQIIDVSEVEDNKEESDTVSDED